MSGYMSDWSQIIAIIGRFLLAFYFLKAGISNAYNWKRLVGLIKSKKIPFPHLVMIFVVVTEILGSFAIIFNFYPILAAAALIVFTLAVNFFICNYWTMEGVQKRNVSFVFYANIAVVGALLLVTSMAAKG
jgi:putative oxidoreductase